MCLLSVACGESGVVDVDWAREGARVRGQSVEVRMRME